MKLTNLKNLALMGVCLASIGVASTASAQSVKHDFMDSRAARRDIQHLKKDRARAVRFKNLGKVAQDDRLIAADRDGIKRDKNKIRRGGG